MKDAIVAEVAQLLHSILGEVRAVKETVGTHESRFDDILLQLKMLQSHDKAPLTTKPRASCDIEMSRRSLDEKAVYVTAAQATNLDILWNRNPLANSTSSLDLGTSDKAEPESPVCDQLPASVLTPGSCERMITISSVVNHSLASIPLHRLADKPQLAHNRRSSDLTKVNIRSQSAPASPTHHSDLHDTPKSSFGKRAMTPTDFSSSTASDIDRSAPADPLTTHSASSLSTSYSLDPSRPSPTSFHLVSNSAGAKTNPPMSAPLGQSGTSRMQIDAWQPSATGSYDRNYSQVSSGMPQSATNDNDSDHVNLTTTEGGINPTTSMTKKRGHGDTKLPTCGVTMSSMNGGLTFRHMLSASTVAPSPSQQHPPCSASTSPADALKADSLQADVQACDVGSETSHGVSSSETPSPGEPMLTFRAMLPTTPEDQPGRCTYDSDHDMESSSAPTEFSLTPSSLCSELTDPNDTCRMSRSIHADCWNHEGTDGSSGSEEDVLHGVGSPEKEKGSPVSLLRPMLRSCHGDIESNHRYSSVSAPRSPFSRSTSATSTPKRKFSEMHSADVPKLVQNELNSAEQPVKGSLAPHVPRLQLPKAGSQNTPTDRYLSPQLNASFMITDLALQDTCNGRESPGRYGRQCEYQAHNSVDSDDMLRCGIMAEGEPRDASSSEDEKYPEDENRPLSQSEMLGTGLSGVAAFESCRHDDTPPAAPGSSGSSYESPPSLVPPTSKMSDQLNAFIASAAGSECTVEMGSCSPMHPFVLPPASMAPSVKSAEDIHSSPCMRASRTGAPMQAASPLPTLKSNLCAKEDECCGVDDRRQSSTSNNCTQSESSKAHSDCHPCDDSLSSRQCGHSPQESGSTVCSSYFSQSLENTCPNALPFIPDTPSSQGHSDVQQGESCGTGTTSQHASPPGGCRGGNMQSQEDQEAGSFRCSHQSRESSCATPYHEDDAVSSSKMSHQAAESLTSDEINEWKAQHCIPALIQESEDDCLVILTNRLLRSAFRAQRREQMQQSLNTGGSYAAPRRFLCSPLDASVLDALAVPVAARAFETSESVESIVDATLPRTLRLSHCFAAWRYIMGGGMSLQSASCSQSLETLGDARTESSQPSTSDTGASDLCTEDAVSCIRRTVVNSRLFSLDVSGHADVRASTASNARSGLGSWLNM